MKWNSFSAAVVFLLCLYALAIIVTWFRKRTIDGDLVFWMGMSVVLLSGFSFAERKK